MIRFSENMNNFGSSEKPRDTYIIRKGEPIIVLNGVPLTKGITQQKMVQKGFEDKPLLKIDTAAGLEKNLDKLRAMRQNNFVKKLIAIAEAMPDERDEKYIRTWLMHEHYGNELTDSSDPSVITQEMMVMKFRDKLLEKLASESTHSK